jgi:lipopolysaccharide export system protein LptA
VLRSNVGMNLWIDSRSGFLGSGRTGPAVQGNKTAQNQDPRKIAAGTPSNQPQPGSAHQEQKAKLVIVTQGPFGYNLRTKQATFDIAKQGGPRPNLVTVDRFVEDKLDHLSCDHLELQFQEAKNNQAAPASSDELEQMDIDSVRATGKEVVLTSDAEILEAHGNDFFYDKRTQLSRLQGNPHMWALKEGNQIEARELQFIDQKGAQQATALGEGRILLLDKKTGTRPLEAHWKNKLVYGKDGGQDLLTLFGEAAFVDHEHGQQIQADLLKVLLEPADPRTPSRGDQPQRRPQRVDALGRVTASSPDLRVHDTETLVLYFKDVPASELQLPPTSSSSPAQAPAHLTSKPSEPEPARPQARTLSMPALVNPLSTGPADPARPKRPIYLSAHQVTAHVLRAGDRNDLEKLWCEGAVHVQQEPASPQDKGVDIRGSQLELAHHIEGNVLTVIGDNAQVQLNKIFILGPQINVDQTTNEAWVTGLGVMRMPSKDSFDGVPRARETELTINWEKSMLFDGQLAKFRGGILAEQDSGHLACQEMDVWLDRKISLREGEKSTDPAKVQKLLCEKDVWIEDLVRQDLRLVSYKRMECFQLSLDNDNDAQESYANASGPGRVRIFALGNKTELLPGLGPAGPQPAEQKKTKDKPATKPSADQQEFKLTQVTYDGRLAANNRKGSATFWDNVQVIHVPSNDPELKINLNRLPEGYLYLHCNKLEVFSHKLPDGRTTKEMRASNKAVVEAKEFSGHADQIKYDESKEQIILEGTEGNPAVLYREKVKGRERESLRGQKIIYWRTSGTFHVENGTGMIGNN